MTINAAALHKTYPGTGSQTAFPYTWPITAAADLIVEVMDASGNITRKALTTDYTVDSVGYPGGGNVNFIVAPASGYTVAITDAPAMSQSTSLQEGGAYSATAVMAALDRCTRLSAMAWDLARRAPHAPVADNPADDTVWEFAGALARANRSVMFDGSGNLLLGTPSGAPVSGAMQPVLAAATLAAARAAMGPWSDALVTTTGASSSRSLAAHFTDIINVLDFGADATGSADSTAAVNAAYAAIPAIGGTLYFPPGTYKINSALSFTGTKPLAIMGAGKFSSILQLYNASGHSITVQNASRFSMTNLSVIGAANRANGGYNVYVNNTAYCTITAVHSLGGTGGLWFFQTAGFLVMTNCDGDSNTGAAGGTCLRIKNTGGVVSNCYFRVGPFASGGYSACSPCLWITGQTTSLQIGNCGFAGGGPHSTFNISGITSNASQFVVTTSAAHDFLAGDMMAIRGASVSTYNTAWRIASVTSTTITVTTTLNPGTATAQGTAESLTACALVTNEDGAVNESRFSNCLFEAGQPNLYGTVGLLFDGRRGGTAISGWNVNGCYFDFGAIGLMFHGGPAATGGVGNVFGFSVAGCKMESSRSCVHIEKAQGITINGLIGNSNVSVTTDQIAVDGSGNGRPMGIYIAAGSSTPYTQGVSIDNSHIGIVADWQTAHVARSHDNAIFLAGQGGANLHEIIVTGCTLYGNQFAVNDDGTGYGSRWKFANNILHQGSIGASEIPSVGSASTLNIYPYHDHLKVTGTTNIQFINPQWAGRELKLLFTGALTLLTGGNLAIAANYSVLAGQMVTLVSDGTSWYVK